MTALLDVRGVTRTFGSLVALYALDLQLAEGEVLAVIGPNGAGKSTLFNIIAGIDHPTSGAVYFRGVPISTLSADAVCRRGVAKTFQIPQLFPGMTVVENVLVGALYGHGVRLDEGRREAEDWLDVVGLGPKARAPAETLSISERRRLDLARALATGAAVLLLDENMAGLGPTEVASAVALLRSLRDRGRSLMVIEHIMRAVAELADRVVVLDHGEKLTEGRPTTVMRDPAVMKAYLGEAPQ